MGFFQFVKVKNSIASHKDFHHLRSKEIDGIHGVVANQHPYLCTVLQYDKHATVYHQIDIAAQYIYQLDGPLYHHTTGHVEQHAIFRQGRIKGRHAIFLGISQTPVILLHQFRMFCRQLSQASQKHTFR